MERRFASSAAENVILYNGCTFYLCNPQHITLAFVLFPLKVTVFAWLGPQEEITTPARGLKQ